MADREIEVVAKLSSGVSGLNEHAWDRLAGDEPFVSHAFLSALEASGSVGKGTGWTPATILVEDGESHLTSAAPAYLKTHSQGEYVFDQGWRMLFSGQEAPTTRSSRLRYRSRRFRGRGCWASSLCICTERPRPWSFRKKSRQRTSRSSMRREQRKRSVAVG